MCTTCCSSGGCHFSSTTSSYTMEVVRAPRGSASVALCLARSYGIFILQVCKDYSFVLPNLYVLPAQVAGLVPSASRARHELRAGIVVRRKPSASGNPSLCVPARGGLACLRGTGLEPCNRRGGRLCRPLTTAGPRCRLLACCGAVTPTRRDHVFLWRPVPKWCSYGILTTWVNQYKFFAYL